MPLILTLEERFYVSMLITEEGRMESRDKDEQEHNNYQIKSIKYWLSLVGQTLCWVLVNARGQVVCGYPIAVTIASMRLERLIRISTFGNGTGKYE